MTPANATSAQHVASYRVELDGSEIAPELMDTLGEIKITDSLMLPDSCDLTMFIPSYDREEAARLVDSQPFEVGKALVVKAGAIGDRAPTTPIFDGEVVAVDADFGHGGVTVGVRAYDRGHKLHRVRKVRVFANQTSSDAVRKVLSEAGFSVTTDASGPPHEWLQQDNETDWEFIWRLARRIDFWLLIEGRRAKFVKAGKSETTIDLAWPDELSAFHPRVTGVQQVREVTARANDPKNKRALTARATSPAQITSIGLTRDKVSKALGGGSLHISGESALEADEVTKVAQATLDRIANAYVEADGHVQGNPRIKAGVKLKITGVGEKFSGTYMCGTVTHSLQGGGGNGRKHFGDQLVIGIVTNNNDPEAQGRLKVKFPALGDEYESGWMRMVTPSAGKERGLVMLPQPDEEVVVGFENGDTRRGYVIGSLFNGKDKPGDELLQAKDGSFAVRSNKKVFAKSLDEMQLFSQKKMTVEVKDNQEIKVDKDRKEKVGGNMTDEISGNFQSDARGSGSLKATGSYTIESSASVTIKAPSITVDASASLTLKAPQVSINGSGMVNISGGIINLG